PKLDIGTGKFCGAEALLRWQHPDEGLLLPNRFISVAERIGLMMSITDWVLVTALKCCKKWNVDGLHAAVAVNVSARSFQDPSLLGKVRGALSEAGVGGNLLEIEVTEDALMADLRHGAKMVEQLTELGVAVAVDDFGIGYSSLSDLKQLPVQSLKIDQSFLANITGIGNDVAIVRSIIELGHNLGCKVVAEGIEDDAAWSMLTELGCDQGQGYHISHPLSERSLNHWLSDSGTH
ncbi:MAG: EAL domain-containing protein, partial [Gammaproteobacteria bacterium]